MHTKRGGCEVFSKLGQAPSKAQIEQGEFSKPGSLVWCCAHLQHHFGLIPKKCKVVRIGCSCLLLIDMEVERGPGYNYYPLQGPLRASMLIRGMVDPFHRNKPRFTWLCGQQVKAEPGPGIRRTRSGRGKIRRG